MVEQHFCSDAQLQGLLQDVSLMSQTYQEQEQLPVEQPHLEAQAQVVFSVLGQGQVIVIDVLLWRVVCFPHALIYVAVLCPAQEPSQEHFLMREL